MTRQPTNRKASDSPPRPLDPTVLSDHIDVLYRAAWALRGSRHEAEGLVRDTFARVLRRPRLLGSEDDDVGYLLRALRNTQVSRRRAAIWRPSAAQLLKTDVNDQPDVAATRDAGKVMAAIAATPGPCRDAVVAVDVVGLSRRQAARQLRAREATLTSRLYRGRQHVARALGEHASPSRSVV